jgi:hypothetical protein
MHLVRNFKGIHRQEELFAGVELLPGQGLFQLSKETKTKQSQIRGVWQVIDWTEWECVQTSDRFPGPAQCEVARLNAVSSRIWRVMSSQKQAKVT